MEKKDHDRGSLGCLHSLPSATGESTVRELAGMQRLDSVVWHGTLIEQLDPIAAVQHNCQCCFQSMGQSVTACASHVMLAQAGRHC